MSQSKGSIGRPLGFVIRDLKHQDGSHADGIPEVYFFSQSCAEPEKLIAICRRPDFGDATFTVLTQCGQRDSSSQSFKSFSLIYRIFSYDR